MFNVWLPVLWFCFNRWPNEVALSKSVVTMQLPDVFWFCSISFTLTNILRCCYIKSETGAPSRGTFGFFLSWKQGAADALVVDHGS